MPEPAGDGIAQSTSKEGSWVGTRQLALTFEPPATIEPYVGRHVRVTGELERTTGTTGPTNQVQHTRGTRYRTLRVSSIELLIGGCAFERSESTAQEKP
jgi:hypothetical protein